VIHEILNASIEFLPTLTSREKRLRKNVLLYNQRIIGTDTWYMKY